MALRVAGLRLIPQRLSRVSSLASSGIHLCHSLPAAASPAAATSSYVPIDRTRTTLYRAFSKKAKHQRGTQPSGQHAGEHHHHAPAVSGSGGGVVDVSSLKARMERVLQALDKDLSGVRGGKADPAMFDHVMVKAYGQSTPLAEVAQVTLKSPTLAVINPYDTELLSSLKAALTESKLELNPRIEGNSLAVPLPKPSAEMRESLVKLAHQYAEKAKLNIRKVRRDGMDGLKSAKDSGGTSEDEVRRQSKAIETITDEVVKKATDMFDKKKKQILTV